MPRLEALERVDVQPDEPLGVRGRDLLDVDPALGREHEERLLHTTVEGQRQVVLALDVGRLLDPEPADDVAADVHAEDRFAWSSASSGVAGELDAAGLAAPARQHLRLDDDLAAELLGRLPRLRRRLRDTSLGDRDAEAAEELLALMLVEVHRAGESTRLRRAPLRGKRLPTRLGRPHEEEARWTSARDAPDRRRDRHDAARGSSSPSETGDADTDDTDVDTDDTDADSDETDADADTDDPS